MRTTSSLFAAALISLVACSTEISAPESLAIDEYIKSLPYLPVQVAQVDQGATSTPTTEGDYQCTTQNLRETREYDRIVAYAANSESLWPGALVAGESIYTGLFSQMVFDRAPATISVSLENLAGKKSAVVKAPSLATYREAVSGILTTEITGATAANIYSEIEQVHTEQQFGLALGIDVDWVTASVKSSFNFSNKNVRSRYLVRYTQAYYTVDIDAPKQPSSLLASTVSLAEVAAKMNETTPPVYVSSITYGRMVVFTFESDYSSEEMQSALDFAYSGGVDVSGQVSVSYKDILSKSKITAYILGGGGAAAARTIDSYDALIMFLKDGGDYSAESPGAPISYKLSYLKDNSPARMSFTSDYEMKECTRVSQKVKVTLKSITVEDAGGDEGDDLELFGSATVTGATSTTLLNKNSDNAIVIRAGNTFPQGNFIAEDVIQVTPKNGESIKFNIRLTDRDGFYSPDDRIGDETVDLKFETGWRRDVSMMLTGDGARVKVTFALQPI
ncbi:MAG: thiol-activated cytolysin family protein [Kofleriaceae bacterium]|nr:thiol-activated cytolysin family protein [Kofleriaceae bacterium]